jgi:hypothetical protein
MAVTKNGPGLPLKTAKDKFGKMVEKSKVLKGLSLKSSGLSALQRKKKGGTTTSSVSGKRTGSTQGGITEKEVKVTYTRTPQQQKDYLKQERLKKKLEKGSGKVKTTPGVTVSAQAPAFGFVAQSHRYGTDTKKASEAYERSISKTKIPSDSAKYFSTLKKIDPKMGAANQAEMSRVYKTTKKTFPNATAEYKVVKGVPRMYIKYNTPVSKMTPQQKAAYEKVQGGQASGQSLKKTMGQK